jgi:hypothetical protein
MTDARPPAVAVARVSSDDGLGGLPNIRAVLAMAVVSVLGLTVWGAFLSSREAQILMGILTAIITTLVSVYATYHSASHSARNELTRYGLLAWRHLDALQLKIRQLETEDSEPVSLATLQAWDLDVDQAKQAWRDLLREAFQLHQRLQAATEELAQDYRLRIAQATNPEDRTKLRAEREAKLAQIASSSPLPLRVPTEVKCPNCASSVVVPLGANQGDTATTACTNCRRTFHAHRSSDGSTFVRSYGQADTQSTLGLIKPESHLREMRLVADVFRVAPEQKVPSWGEFKRKLQAALAEHGLDREADARIHPLLFRLKAFHLFGPSLGIGLAVSPDHLVDFVEQKLIALTGLADPEQVCSRLYGANTERLDAIRASMNQPAPAPVTQ